MSSHFEAAFPTAAVALGVWSEHPDIGDLLLASFYHTCPILVPLPIPTPPKVTEGEYKRWVTHTPHAHTHTHTQHLVQYRHALWCSSDGLPCPTPAPPHRLLGYSTSNNVMEDDDKFLKRMSGVVRLFAAMVQCPAVIWGQVGGEGRGWDG